MPPEATNFTGTAMRLSTLCLTLIVLILQTHSLAETSAQEELLTQTPTEYRMFGVVKDDRGQPNGPPLSRHDISCLDYGHTNKPFIMYSLTAHGSETSGQNTLTSQRPFFDCGHNAKNAIGSAVLQSVICQLLNQICVELLSFPSESAQTIAETPLRSLSPNFQFV